MFKRYLNDGAAEGNGSAKPAPVDLSTKIKLPDGSEKTLGELYSEAGNATKAAADAASQAKKLEEQNKHLLTVFNPQATPEVKEKALRAAWKSLGMSEQDIDAQVTYLKGDDKPTEEVEGGDNEGGDDVSEDRIKQLEAQIKQLTESHTGGRKKQLEKALGDTIDTFIKGNKDVEAMKEVIRKQKGDKAPDVEAKLLKTLKNQIDTQVRAGVRLRVDNGEPFDEQMFHQEADKAAKELLEPYQSVIEAAQSVGRAPETVTGMEYIKSKPVVKAPEYKPGQSVPDLDKQLGDWLTDSFTRDALEVATEASKV